jgi:hypothetical protein
LRPSKTAMKEARPTVNAGSRKCQPMTQANWIRDKTRGFKLIAPRLCLRTMRPLLLRPQEPKDTIMDGCDFHEDSERPESLGQTADSGSCELRSAWSPRWQARRDIGLSSRTRSDSEKARRDILITAVSLVAVSVRLGRNGSWMLVQCDQDHSCTRRFLSWGESR